MIEHALALAARGFHVFPVKAGAKMPPLIKDFPTKATRVVSEIESFWKQWPDANIGISTSRFGDDEALLVVDVDNKGAKNGDASIVGLELAGCELPDTYVQSTPTGGSHRVYRVSTAVGQSVGKIGDGLDIRSRSGYILAAGSRVDAGVYRDAGGQVSDAPEWLVARCASKVGVDRKDGGSAPAVVDQAAAIARARQYIEHDAPLAIEGQGGDQTTYAVACRVRDFGVDIDGAFALLSENWNDRCSPPWDLDALADKVAHAYTYAQDTPGNAAPEAVFKPIETLTDSEHPFAKLNRVYAYLVKGDTVLFETNDEKGRPVTDHMTVQGFNRTHAAWKMQVGKRSEPVTSMWMEHESRRTYERIVFAPKGDAGAQFYNLWRGFSVEPAATSDHPAVSRWLDHCLNNVCQGDAKLNAWLVGYFAHMVQKPWEKPLVALVFKGSKGVGKNALVGAIGGLLGGHYLLSSNRRYLVGNFNGHLENLLLFVLDEAFWSGDKQAEGTLKDLITGGEHVIEHKGKEPYAVANLTRVAIIGNEGWLVPASHDERRFAVFNVGDGRKQDRHFFQAITDGMVAGGASALLRYLLDFDISGLEVNLAPDSAGLLEQKHSSLEPFMKWWLLCLQDGMLHGSEFGEEWPERAECKRFATAYKTWQRDNNITARPPGQVLKALNVFAPSITRTRLSKHGQVQPYAYALPPLAQAREEWSVHMGQKVDWE